MNTEKELLLALLIEKYSKQQNKPIVAAKATKPVKHKRTRRSPHRWSNDEKNLLLDLHAKGNDIKRIAYLLQLRPKQVDNMLYSLLKRPTFL